MIRKANQVKKREDVCAREVLDVVPSVMRFIRAEMRGHRGPDLSVPQFRSLGFIERVAGTSLGGLAEHLGLTAPSASALIDGLSHRGLVRRLESPGDRRRLTLEITAEGSRVLASARDETQRSLSDRLAVLEGDELSEVTRAMSVLRRVFTAGTTTPSEGRFSSHVNPQA